MRTLLAWGLLAALALPARADIVDSGSLIIGGQGIIGGTFTVQGNAMSVAGSVSATSATLSGTGNNVFSLTTSSGIHLVSGVVRWPDGSTSSSANSGGGSGVSGPWRLVAIASSASGLASLSIPMEASTTYRLRGHIAVSTGNSSGYIAVIRFNSDSGANYNYKGQFTYASVGTIDYYWGSSNLTGTGYALCSRSFDTYYAGDFCDFEFAMRSVWGLPKKVGLHGTTVSATASFTDVSTGRQGGVWSGSSVPTTLDIVATASVSFVGEVILEKFSP